MDILAFLKNYQAYDELEEAEKLSAIQVLEAYGDKAYYRECLASHMSASAWVVNKKHDKVLMCYHNIFKDWSWLGGHADGEKDLLKVALKEVEEESGLKNVRPVLPEPIDVNICVVGCHTKRGKVVCRHLHINPTYLLEADENEALKVKTDENSGLKWFTFDEVSQKCHSMLNAYERIIKKIRERKL